MLSRRGDEWRTSGRGRLDFPRPPDGAEEVVRARRRRRGREHAVRPRPRRDGGPRLVLPPARPARALVTGPAQCRPDAARLPVLDVDGVGPGPHDVLQRRLPGRHAARQAPVGARPLRARGVGRGLGRRRPADRVGARRRRGHLGRGPPAVPRTQRPPRGDLPHLLLQPAARGRRRRRDAVRGHREHRPRAQRTAHADPARPRRRPGADPHRGAGVRGGRARAGRQPRLGARRVRDLDPRRPAS